MLALLLLATLHEVASMSPTTHQRFRSGPDHGLPFSRAVRAGGFVYAAGVLGTDAGGRLAPDDVRQQTRHALSNLKASFEAAGTSLDRAVAIHVYLTRASDFQAMNEVYRTFWPDDPPTRTTVVAGLTAPGALIEIAGTAVPIGVERVVVHPPGWPASRNPYSYGIRSGDTLFLSGLVSRDPRTGQDVKGDMATQARTVLDNARAILAAGGMGPADVASARVFITDGAAFPAMNEAYRGAFPAQPPARATVVAGLMSSDLVVEMTFVAVRDMARRTVTTPRADGTPGAANPNLSSAVEAGGRLFLSGMLGNTEAAGADARAQARETLARLARTLAAAGYGLGDVVDAVVYLTEARHFAAMNEAWREVFARELPARATVVTGLVAPGAVVEIALVATR